MLNVEVSAVLPLVVNAFVVVVQLTLLESSAITDPDTANVFFHPYKSALRISVLNPIVPDPASTLYK